MMALDILVCPLCKGPLTYDRQRQTLSCQADRLAFPIRDGVPVMIEGEATPLEPAPAPTPTDGSAPTPTDGSAPTPTDGSAPTAH